jgi:hypothetical protein
MSVGRVMRLSHIDDILAPPPSAIRASQSVVAAQ